MVKWGRRENQVKDVFWSWSLQRVTSAQSLGPSKESSEMRLRSVHPESGRESIYPTNLDPTGQSCPKGINSISYSIGLTCVMHA